MLLIVHMALLQQKSVLDRAAAVSTFPQGIIARYKKPRPRLVVMGKGELLLKFQLKDINIYQRLHLSMG